MSGADTGRKGAEGLSGDRRSRLKKNQRFIYDSRGLPANGGLMFQLYDERKKKRYPLTGLIKEIGRTSECDVCIPDDDQVSRVHARLDWDGSNWVLLAALIAGSSIGVYYYLRVVYYMTRRQEEHGIERVAPVDPSSAFCASC